MTRPTEGRAHHPVITRVSFETTAKPDAEPAAKYAAALLARTVRHLDQLKVKDLVEETLRARPDYDDLDYHELDEARFSLQVLAEAVRLQAQDALRQRLSIDLATTLLPRLKGTRSL